MRLPFTRTRVRPAPNPRRLANEAPPFVSLTEDAELVIDWFEVMNDSACSALVTPAFARSSAFSTVTGNAVSALIWRIDEPVMVTL